MNKKINFEKLINYNTSVIILLVFNFFYRLFLYYSTDLFYFSDYEGYLNLIESIKKTGYIGLASGPALLLNSYIGYFFKYVVGSIEYWYVFNCFLGTLSSIFLYVFLIKTFESKKIGFVYLIIITIYSEFIALSSVFYTQVIEIFLFSIIINCIRVFHRKTSLIKILYYMLFIVLVVNLSFFFKGTLRYLWFVFASFSIFVYKKRKLALKYLILSLVLISFDYALLNLFPSINKIVSSNDVNNPAIIPHLLFGHTLYGGDGGEGTFIYSENSQKFHRNYALWMEKNNVINPTQETLYKFQKHEILSFVSDHPFKWIKLQVYKFTRTFGIVPEGTTFQILYSGLFKFNWILTSLFLQIPYTLILILFILFFDFRIVKIILDDKLILIWLFLFIYWVGGSIFYGPFQERYRIPLMVIFIIPLLSIFLAQFNYYEFISNKFRITLKVIFLFLILSIWSFQGHHALVIKKDRYINFVNNTTNINDMVNQLDELGENQSFSKKRAYKIIDSKNIIQK